jgi:undecaprenyl-diphosphatase
MLGIIQGLTEFLPVSSSGHLVIMQRILGITEEQVAVTVILHLGTILALVIFFFKDIINLLKDARALFRIFIVTLITGAIAVIGKDFFENLFSAPRLVALAWVVTGIILILTKEFTQTKRSDINIKDAVILGFTQGVAIIPGISRSGITISTLLFRGIDRKVCFAFSFLISIPLMLGAAVFELKKIEFALNGAPYYLAAGFISSAVTGVVALWILMSMVKRAKLYYFGYYCVLAGITTLLFVR